MTNYYVEIIWSFYEKKDRYNTINAHRIFDSGNGKIYQKY